MSGTPPVLVAVIELLIAYHPKVLRILLGEYEPTLLELAEIVRNASEPADGARVSSGARSRQLAALMRGESIQDAVDRVGGWRQLAEAALFYRDRFPATWGIFADHVMHIASGDIPRIEERSLLQSIAETYGVSRSTVSEKRRLVPYAIARYAEMAPYGELQNLRGGTYTPVPGVGCGESDRQMSLPFEG